MGRKDRELLREALLKSDKKTQAFLEPILRLRSVQQVLLTFVHDETKSFEEWVWDPSVRQVLTRLRDQHPEKHHHAQNLDTWFNRAMSDQATKHAEQEEVPAQKFLADADETQQDGKQKFKSRNYYAAINAFKKSIEALKKYQRSKYYGQTVEPAEWEDAMQERYVTLCNNIAICAIKLEDRSVIKEYAVKALAVNESSSKALYAMAKLHLMEHMYEDAHQVLDKALQYHPDNQLLLKFRLEIDEMHAKESQRESEAMALMKKKYEALGLVMANETKAAEERQKEWKERVLKAHEVVRLPTLEDDSPAATRLNNYFMRIKHHFLCEIKPLHNPDNGEPPLFECSISNGTTGVALATGIRGSSKKAVKNEACKVAIKRLWELKKETGTLLKEDAEYLAKFEEAERAGTLLSLKSTSKSNLQQKTTGESNDYSLPIKISYFERQHEPAMLLNQLHMQRRLKVQIDFDDLSPPTKEITEFQCTVSLNGEKMAVARAPSKKKARTEATKQALAAAVDRGIIVYWKDTTEEENNEDRQKAE